MTKPKRDLRDLNERARSELTRRSDEMGADDVARLLERRDELEAKFSGSGPLGKLVADAKLLFAMVGDYRTRAYTAVPWASIAAAAAALTYVLVPVDMIPDMVPVIGLVDDAAVMSLCLLAIDANLQDYKRWRLQRVMADA
jgi:uncharacterized membrane protein YkvA (DUF1232 family)